MLRRTVRLIAGCCARADATRAGTATHTMAMTFITGLLLFGAREQLRKALGGRRNRAPIAELDAVTAIGLRQPSGRT